MSTTPKPDLGTAPKREDWEQTMADIKRLVEALNSLTSPPSPANPKPEPEPRKFATVTEDSLRMFTPQGGTMRETLIRALLSIFVSREEEEAALATQLAIAAGLKKILLPSFADKLTLRFSVEIPTLEEPAGSHKLNRTRLGEHILAMDSWDLYVIDEEFAPVKRTSKNWCWTPPPGGKFRLCRLDGLLDGKPFWRQERRIPLTRFFEAPINSTGPGDFGALCLLQTPIQDSILKFKWIEFVLAQTGFLNYKVSPDYDSLISQAIHRASFLCFLGIFAGYWPSGAERADFSFKADIYSANKFNRYYTQIHFRCFILTDTFNNMIGSDGLQCSRQRGKIESSALGITARRFEERRISIFGVLSNFEGYQRGFSTEHVTKPSIYRVLILSEADVDFPFRDLEKSDLKWHPGFGGTLAFQRAILLTVRVWEREWNKVMDGIDDCLRVQLDQTMVLSQMDRWMFDDHFARSRLYFTILQILRIFGECIRTVSADLRILDGMFLNPTRFASSWLPSEEELHAFSSNWRYITKQQKDAEERLLGRLLDKTEEVKSLRDGLFNASSLQEANRSTTMNRYVIIFTVVTVLYLPPSFVSTVFGMTIFQKGVVQTTQEYKVTTVIVSLITYLVALLSVVAVDWAHNKRKILKWWQSGIDNMKGISDQVSAPTATPPSTSLGSKPGDTEKKSGQGAEPKDLESANDEGAGNATKSRPSWHINMGPLA